MKISRRSFLTLLGIAPAIGSTYLHLADGSPDEMLVLPEELPLGKSGTADSLRFVTSSETIMGPAKVFEFQVPPHDGGGYEVGSVAIFRSESPKPKPIVKWGFQPRGGYRWCACPNGEIFVPSGGSLIWKSKLDCFKFYERPNKDGHYTVPRSVHEVDWDAIHREQDREAEECFLD